MEKTTDSSADVSSSVSAAISSADESSTPAASNTCDLGGSSSSNSKTNSLNTLNRASYKITKPLPRNANPVAARAAAAGAAPPEEVPLAAPSRAGGVGGGGGAPPYQPQPPVYNIDKSDFRDVVQKLTGSPVHNQTRPRPADPPPPPRPPSAATIPASAGPTSRLHRIRPPPLAHLLHRPPPVVPAPPMQGFDPWIRTPLSPLPPLPTVSAAAESPISAYMRRLRGGSGGLPVLAPLPTAAPVLPPPSSPLGFGCLMSPRTAYLMMVAAPGIGLPTSPGVQLPSPRLGDP
ncbi:hypothetical protein Cni_G11472 [Canna indica]|uniref:VQ domain-containing protein n=1 Tax=Canna indica TaxID=4628 RepID=A0AAQ3K8T9_9LILI|nr:hypothetical protein Cni_G11472 [Canna indica]